MKKIVPFFVCFLLAGFYAQAQEDERSLPKGQLLDNPVRPAFTGYKNQAVLFEATEASDFTGWKSLHWQPGPDGLATGPYQSNVPYVLESPAIQLPVLKNAAGRIILYLEEQFEIESYYDKGLVQVSEDGGGTWKTVSIRDGKSSWRTSVINLTAYAGKSVRIALRLAADEAYEYQGWTVKSLRLRHDMLESPASSAGSVAGAQRGGNARIQATLSGQITSVDAQRFPRYIYTSVKVAEAGSPLLTLDSSHFSVREFINYGVTPEDDTLTVPHDDDHFRVYTPSGQTIAKPVDIVFLMDNSGSMGNEQDSVAANVANFVNQLDTLNFDFRLGLCRFGQGTGNGDPIFHDNARFYSSASDFITVWNTVNTVNGGREVSWDALHASSIQYSFRSGAQKVFILITDEAMTGNNINLNPQITDRQVVIDQLTNAGVTMYALVPSSAVFQDDFGTIATATGGRSYNIFSPFNDILQDIGSEIDGTYIIRYAPTDPAFNGIPRDVEVTVNYNSEILKIVKEEAYTPGSAPIILRTDQTLALHDEAQLNSVPVTIEVQAVDWDVSPYTSDVTLYYRTVGATTPYIAVPMTRTQLSVGSPAPPALPVTDPTTSIWEATIPGANVLDPGIQYYIRATDGSATTIAPEFIDRPGFPFAFAVLPNLPPDLDHTPIETADPKADIVFTADAIDNTNAIDKVYLYYRKEADIGYINPPVEMTLVSGNTYQYTLPALNVNTILYYYIVAIDNFGVPTNSGSDTSPHAIAVGVPWTTPSSPFVHTVRFFSGGPFAATVTIDDIPLANGDVIGVFYDAGSGVLKPAGNMVWPSLAMPVYGDDPLTTAVEGAPAGAPFIFKIYRKADGEIYNVDDPEAYVPPGAALSFDRGKQSLVKTLKAYSEQAIALQPGLNLASTYLAPVRPDFADIVAPVSSSVQSVTDSDDNTYTPGSGGTLTTHQTGYGYRFFMNNATILRVKGPKTNASGITVALNDQGVIVGCPYRGPENVESVFPRFDPNIYIVDKYITDSNGNVTIETYSPAWDINGWTNKNMEPGHGYYVYTFTGQNFTFPAASGPHTARIASTGKATSAGGAQPITSVDNYMHVMIPRDSWTGIYPEGSELRIYNTTGKLTGKAPLRNDGTIVTIDGTLMGGDGKFFLRLWHPDTDQEEPVYVSEWRSGNSMYKNHTASVTGKISTGETGTYRSGLEVFPNPVEKEEVTVYFSLAEDHEVSIQLLDVQLGRAVRNIARGHYAKGDHAVKFSKQGLAAGLYLVKLNRGAAFETRKIVVK